MRTYIAPITSDTSIVSRCRVALYEWMAHVLTWLATALAHAPPQLRNHPLVRDAIAEVETKIAAQLRLWAKVLRRMLVAEALARFQPAHRKMQLARHPHDLAHGLRRTRVNQIARRLTNGILSSMHHGSLRDRALRLKRALDRFEALVARTLARFVKAWRCPMRGALVIAAPQSDCILSATALTPACADSS